MDSQMLKNSFLSYQAPETPSSSRSSWSPSSSLVANYNENSPPHTPPIKQTWEEFCREQEGIRLFCQNSPSVNSVPLPYRPSSTLSLDLYRNSPQPSIVRPHSTGGGNRWPSRNSNNNAKRNQAQDTSEQEPLLKTTKKRKKPLSQNVPAKKEWTIEEAERALSIERECNKRSKSALIIKFPDLELNRDIVAGFHADIENVHFQQPSTPRFCFVTLKETSDAEEVIAALNKHKFGDNFLVAEHKKDREEDQAVCARDVDPFTLYVGNLAQEITKEDMVQLYPTSRRIDIGYAKKMKYTRYAFVVFHTVDAAIESFKRTHNHQIYNKSLIVRFRRLHGTVGMPGDTKQQNPPKQQPSPEKKSISQSTTEDSINTTRAQPRLTPFSINVKQESEYDNEYDEEYNSYDELSETSLCHHPKSIKLEIKREVKPEVYEYGPDTKVGIKTELKHEHRFIEPEFNEYSDAELEQDSDYYQHEDDFEEVFQNFANQRRQASSLRSSML